MKFGLDYLLAANYSKDTIATCVKEHPQGWGVGVFSTLPEGGSSYEFVKKIISTRRCPFARIHMMWKDRHNYSRNDFPKIVAEATKWAPMIKNNPKIMFYISGACEHNLNASDATELKNQVLKVLPGKNVIYVNTPLTGKGSRITTATNVKNEGHGSVEKWLNASSGFSFDGTSAVDVDVQLEKDRGVKQNIDYFFFWIPQFNMKLKTTDKTPRPDRKVTLSAPLIRSVIYLATDKGATTLSDKYIYKTHSEQTINETALDTRGNRPVVIAPQKVSSITFVAKNGQVVDTALYYGEYAGGGYRYYSRTFGYLIAEKACSVVTLKAGAVTLGTVNPAFRGGKFR